ncbi:MAG: tetratricopeptide repeat protein [Deltaproteobacteria bacterium]|nr:tetratricopeptide repeat protein [Deltaproteobacteria bacterium]
MSASAEGARGVQDDGAEHLGRVERGIAHHAAGGDPTVLASLHFQAAQLMLARRRDGDIDTAIRHLWEAWRAQPGNLDTRLLLHHCLAEAGQARPLAELQVQAAELATDGEERGALFLSAAELLAATGDPDGAVRLYQRTMGLRGEALRRMRVTAARRAEALLDDGGSLEGQVWTLSLVLPDLQDDDPLECALRMAELQHRLGRESDAYASYRLALSLQPGAPRALAAARRHLETHEQWEELAELLATSAPAAASSTERAALWRELARLSELRLGDRERACQAWWHAWDEEQLGEEPTELKRLYAQGEDWGRYLQVLQRETLRAVEVPRKLAVYRELATFQREMLEDELAAAETYGLMLQLDPDDLAALRERVEIFERSGRTEQAVIALRRYANQQVVPEHRDEALRRLVELERTRGRLDQLERLVARLDPTNPANHAFAAALLARLDPASRERHAIGLRLMSMRQAAGLPAGEYLELLRDLAEQSRERGETGAAAELYRRVLAERPEDPAALAALAGLRASERVEDPGVAELSGRAEALAAAHPEQAVRLLIQAAHRADAEADDAQAGRNELLKRALDLCPPSATAELRLLEDALREAGLRLELGELLATAARHESRADRKKDLLQALAHLLRDELGDPVRAVEAFEQALTLDPRDTAVAQEVRRLHRVLDNHAALARTLEDLLPRTTDRERIQLLEELGGLYAGPLRDAAGALRHYGDLLSLVPDHDEALAYCRAHDEASGDYRSVAVLLSRAAEAADDPVSRAELHRNIAQLAEQHLHDLDFAAAQWRRVVELCPTDGAPRSELRRLLSALGRLRELEALLLNDISRSLKPEEKIPVYLDLARLAADQMQDLRTAAGYLRNALQLAPQHREVLGRLVEVYEKLSQWRELAAILRRCAELEPDLERRSRHLTRAARVLAAHLGRDDDALALCQKVREARPGDRAAATLLAEIFARRGAWRELALLIGEQIGVESDPLELARLHLDMGRLLLERLNDPETAATHFEQALELDAGRGDILPLLRRLYTALGRWDLLVALIRRRASADELPPLERAAALCEIGRICAEQQSDVEGAKEAFERAVHLAPTYRPAVTAVRQLALAQQQWRDAVAAARLELKLIEDPAERTELLLQTADILLKQLNRPSAAAEALEEALQADPKNAQAAERLSAIYFEAGDYQRAGDLLEQVVSSGAELPDLHDYFYRLGFASEQLGDEDQAFSYYVKSFGREPMYLPTLNRLVELCYRRRQWDNTLRIAEALIETYTDQKSPEEMAELWLKVGLCHLHLAQRDVAVRRLQELVLRPGEVPRTPLQAWQDVAESWASTPLEPQLLGQVDTSVLSRVIKAMEQVLVSVPQHGGALQVLAALTLSRADWDRSLRYLERAAEVPRLDRKTQAALLLSAGDVAARRLLSAQRAEGYYRRALALLPGSVRVRERLEQLTEGRRAPGRPAAGGLGAVSTLRRELGPRPGPLPPSPVPLARRAPPPPPPPLPMPPVPAAEPEDEDATRPKLDARSSQPRIRRPPED